MSKWWCAALLLGLLACQRQAPVSTQADAEAPSPAPVKDVAALGPVRAPGDELRNTTYWPVAKLDNGSAWVGCDYDYLKRGDGQRLPALDFFSLADALRACQATGVVRVRYQGKIGVGFTALMQRVAVMADRLEIGTRVLDIDSSGGHVEEAIRAGDFIAESHWAIWVREGSICHSACVLVLAAGDTRSISGKVGIHRLMRDRSRATSRAELSEELKGINAQVREYLERNGVAMAVADLMMTIANRDLRLLTEAELKQYGLDGTNAAQDDLDRIRAMRLCGEDFVRRRDAFRRDFDAQCMEPGKAFEARAQCGLSLREQHGFPDAMCPDETPMPELDRILALAARAAVAESGEAVADPASSENTAETTPNTLQGRSGASRDPETSHTP